MELLPLETHAERADIVREARLLTATAASSWTQRRQHTTNGASNALLTLGELPILVFSFRLWTSPGRVDHPSGRESCRLSDLARSSTPKRTPRRSARRRQSNDEAAIQKEEAVVLDAVVTQALPNAMFEVELENGHTFIAYAAGRMRRYRIRITPGDRIRAELSPYDLNRGRVVYRYRD
jgi:translation initiation factor IF-1